jgi:NAD(P)-dependent dehydrogenase (short-subunit alcohol dehydrogenase family)
VQEGLTENRLGTGATEDDGSHDEQGPNKAVCADRGLRMSRIALVTGAARGLGLELCRQLLARDDTVVACPRSRDGDELQKLQAEYGDRCLIEAMDVGNESSVTRAARAVGERVDRIDVLFNNAGVYPKDEGGLEQIDVQDLVRAFDVNTAGPLRVTRALLPLLRRGRDKRLVQITSLMGSIADNTSGGAYGYRLSKAALNMLVKNMAHELGREGFIALAVHPGWVQTRMGGSAAPMAQEEAVEQILRNTFEAGPEDNGAFYGPGRQQLPF